MIAVRIEEVAEGILWINPSRAEIGRMIRAHAREHFPPEWQEEMINLWLAGRLDGYTRYFMEKGFFR